MRLSLLWSVSFSNAEVIAFFFFVAHEDLLNILQVYHFCLCLELKCSCRQDGFIASLEKYLWHNKHIAMLLLIGDSMKTYAKYSVKCNQEYFSSEA